MSVNEIKITKAEKAFQVQGSGDPSSRTFIIGDEDHTLGNAIRHVLMQNAQVGFAGYSCPHPSEPVVHVRVQTVGSSKDKEEEEEEESSSSPPPLTATKALKDASLTLSNVCDFLLEELEKTCPEVKEDRLKIEQYIEETTYYADEDEDEYMEEVGEEY